MPTDMSLELVLRQQPDFREVPQGILFRNGDIVRHGEEAEDSVD